MTRDGHNVAIIAACIGKVRGGRVTKAMERQAGVNFARCFEFRPNTLKHRSEAVAGVGLAAQPRYDLWRYLSDRIKDRY